MTEEGGMLMKRGMIKYCRVSRKYLSRTHELHPAGGSPLGCHMGLFVCVRSVRGSCEWSDSMCYRAPVSVRAILR